MKKEFLCFLTLIFLCRGLIAAGPSNASPPDGLEITPIPLPQYAEKEISMNIKEKLAHRISEDPFNLIATIVFILAIIHTFMAKKFLAMAHHYEQLPPYQAHHSLPKERQPINLRASICHYLGEIEVVFGIWAMVLGVLLTLLKSWETTLYYFSNRNYTEPLFVVVIMAISASRPILKFAESALKKFASLGKGSPAAWWLTLLIVAPILGSFITEPAAMTIAALLLSKKFYDLKPSNRFKYGTLGLLFVNISVGGTLTHFAAPPVLMVAGTWEWDTVYLFTHFGWKACLGITLTATLYFFFFRKEFAKLKKPQNLNESSTEWEQREATIPPWVTIISLGFLGWTIFNSHNPVMFILGFLVFIAFSEITALHQNPLSLKTPLLVGFFLAGIILHGGFQGWWIEPVLGSLGEWPLMIGATVLTAFNDNAAITYLATLVPNFSESLKYAVVAGAVTGGGLTVIANAPNPAGQIILGKHFKDGISPLGLFLGAAVPTLILGACFMLIR